MDRERWFGLILSKDWEQSKFQFKLKRQKTLTVKISMGRNWWDWKQSELLLFINSLKILWTLSMWYMPDFVWGTGDSGGKKANVNYSLAGKWHWRDRYVVLYDVKKSSGKSSLLISWVLTSCQTLCSTSINSILTTDLTWLLISFGHRGNGKHKEAKWITQGHRGSKQWHWDLNPAGQVLKPCSKLGGPSLNRYLLHEWMNEWMDKVIASIMSFFKGEAP